MASFPRTLPALPADAPHLLSPERLEQLAQAAVAGLNPATHYHALPEARYVIGSIDSSFARAKVARDNKRIDSVEARRAEYWERRRQLLDQAAAAE